ncbi:oxygen-insensitive NADPH nitroreductase [Parendozoicomonas sp. Alg238-R29]|uniref:oxygen-insensitive NADPH nitroreductase n=1 Tax=Parendozoicomonas sp. Alg238-R29 TaxID=2993446 RepID=UPI00248EFE3F|nr:oxygen-insensitive NADPH nitroreductase [Parendozoicomonas sp. Alg238-R29]
MSDSVIELLKSHRSIRKFTDQPVDEDLVRELIRAGQSAATSSNLQGVSVVRIRSPKTRASIAELAGGQSYVESAAAFFMFCADLNRSGYCCETLGGKLADGMTEHFIIATVDVALFAQNVAVAAESEGLGICYIGGIRNNPSKVSELLELPENVYPVFGMCIGYPDQNPDIKPRLPVDMVLMEETWQPLQQDMLDEYDATMREYYRTRSNGKLNRTWSADMEALLGKESRPHMKEFLSSKGFKMR